ncbi:MAG: hypothetical protein AAFY60_13575, partial [Myxococcota bacterium]
MRWNSVFLGACLTVCAACGSSSDDTGDGRVAFDDLTVSSGTPLLVTFNERRLVAAPIENGAMGEAVELEGQAAEISGVNVTARGERVVYALQAQVGDPWQIVVANPVLGSRVTHTDVTGAAPTLFVDRSETWVVFGRTGAWSYADLNTLSVRTLEGVTSVETLGSFIVATGATTTLYNPAPTGWVEIATDLESDALVSDSSGTYLHHRVATGGQFQDSVARVSRISAVGLVTVLDLDGPSG